MRYSDTAYVYDGSLEGLLTAVFTAFENNEEPIDITSECDTMFKIKLIDTDTEKAARVVKGITGKLGRDFADMIKLAYLSKESGVEIKILRFIRLGYRIGGNIMKNLDDPTVFSMFRLAKSVSREAHRIIEFMRFSDYNGNLISVINPKYFILPLIKSHFEERFPNENFFIYDEVFGAALVKVGRQSVIVPFDEFVMPEATEEEEKFRKLWKLFYDTIEIKERRNHKLRMQHLPKRFWKNVTELADEIKLNRIDIK